MAKSETLTLQHGALNALVIALAKASACVKIAAQNGTGRTCGPIEKEHAETVAELVGSAWMKRRFPGLRVTVEKHLSSEELMVVVCKCPALAGATTEGRDGRCDNG